MTKRTRRITAAKSAPQTPRSTTTRRSRRATPSRKKKTLTKISTAHGTSYVGSDIARTINNELYTGTITNYYPRRSLWRVTYTDDDEEELNHLEVLHAINLAQNNEPTSHVGKRVARKFENVVYFGNIDKYDGKEKLWHILFDDDDQEELEFEEVLFALDLYENSIVSDKDNGENIMDDGVEENNEETETKGSDDEQHASPESSPKIADDKIKTKSSPLTIPVIVITIAIIIHWLFKQVVAVDDTKIESQEDILGATLP